MLFLFSSSLSSYIWFCIKVKQEKKNFSREHLFPSQAFNSKISNPSSSPMFLPNPCRKRGTSTKSFTHRRQGAMNHPSKGTCLSLICRASPDVGPDTERHFKIGEMGIIQLIHTWDYLGRALVGVGIPMLLALWRAVCFYVCLVGAAYFRPKTTTNKINKKFLQTSPDIEYGLKYLVKRKKLKLLLGPY